MRRASRTALEDSRIGLRPGALLCWRDIPPWLRAARVLLFIAAAGWAAAMMVAFGIQGETLSSPKVAQGPFRHPEVVKGAVRFLTDQTDQAYRITTTLIPSLWFAAMALLVVNKTFDQRIKDRIRRAQLDAIAERMAAEDCGDGE